VARILIIPPYRLDQFAAFSVEAFIDWLQKTVRAGGPIWDFAGYNEVTADPANYVDAVHFDRKTGDRILRRVCGAPDDTGASADFGVRLTEANLEDHIAALRLQHERARRAISEGRHQDGTVHKAESR
jgi:hypothetical protein